MSHPYETIPDAQRWSRAMAGRASVGIDPVTPPPFRIGALTRVVTAGSCFAQHVARHLREQGHACFETEPAHPLLPLPVAAAFNYGIYSARYGNIYTSRQLLQLWRRSTGRFVPHEDRWDQDGACFDPFRPAIQPGGFSSAREYAEDRRQHFAAVRQAFSEMDVFVFTLGLTECWASREDGAVYPLCPGVVAGHFDPQRHVLLNLTTDEVAADLRAFIEEVREVNPRMQMILTVSPVPLAATAEAQHVLAATTYSKAVLRVAAEQVCRLPGMYYFPSFEIVNVDGPASFAADRRSVNESSVLHVMSLFFRHLMEQHVEKSSVSSLQDVFLQQAQAVVDTLCDEQRLDPTPRPMSQPSATSQRSCAMTIDVLLDQGLARADELMRQHRFDEAIEGLADLRRQHPDDRLELALALCRYRSYAEQSPQSNVSDPWHAGVPDPFADVVGVPEISASQLDAATLVAGIRFHGALLVRGLLDEPVALQLAAGIRTSLDACAAWHESGEGAFDNSWYARLPLQDGCELAQARPWVESAGGVWVADSPRMLHELTELFESRGLIDVIAGYFGERPMMSVGKSTLRCVPSTQGEADWHQDGAFMGTDIRSVNLWLSLSHCGHDASGLEVLPRRLSRVLPTGSHGAHFSWSVGPGMLEIAAEGMSTVSPVFAPGDALLFDHYFLHRTGVPAAISKDRYAIESWFFAPSAYPKQQVPLRL
jgi:hypothetical protein